MEQVDQPEGAALADFSVALHPKLGHEFQEEYQAGLLDGVTVLHHKGAAREVSSEKEPLYVPASPDVPRMRTENLTLIPYYAWANRKEAAMQVWVPYTRV